MSTYEGVPEKLRRQRRWVCWRRVERDGRQTKMPVDAASGRMAKSTDPKTWCSFDEADAAARRLGCDGIGFVFGPDRAFTGLDLDHVMKGGILADEYRWVVEAAATYTEISPSGDGLHLIFAGPKPEGALRCRKGPVEMYDHDRFFTVTGNVFEGRSTLRSAPDVIERAYRTWIEPVQKQGGTSARGRDDTRGCSMEDADVIERMRASKNGPAIAALLSGDTSANGGDRSAADMALCAHLAFWCAGDAEQMDRIFRASGLMRDKWDSRRGASTYGEQTIARAIEGARSFYDPSRAKGARRAPASTSPDKNVCSTASSATVDKGNTDPLACPPSIEGWFADERGVLWTVDREGELRFSVTSTAPWIACDLIDVDTGDVRALVRLGAGGSMRERALDRDVLLNQSKIIGALAPMGANVSSTNAKDVVRYLTDCERRLGSSRPRAKSVTHLGWSTGPLGPFMPYDAGAGDVRFDPSPDEAVKARPFMEASGTLAEWVAGVAGARDASMAFRCMMAASFASPLVSLLDVQTFIVYLWGRSRSGKTPTLKAAGSVWGDPTEGADSYFRTFADTPKSIIRAAALLHDIPVIIDELQSKGSPGGQATKRQIVEDLLYSLSLGHERAALNSDRSMMRAGSWRALTLATGEIPIVGDATQQGAANRTLELNAEPFGDVRAAQRMHHLVAAQHGTAGRAFIEALRRNDRAFYARQFETLRDCVCERAAGHPQADNISLVALADALAQFYVFAPGTPWADCLEGALALAGWALANATGSTGADTDLKAIQFVSEWLVRNKIHFEDTAEMDRLERYGSMVRWQDRPGFCWYVFSSTLDRALSDANFDRQKTLRRMAEEGLLVLGGGRGYSRQRRFGDGTRVYCVAINNEALVEFLDRELATSAAVLIEGGDSPC